jgi:hypothetical protein
MDIDDPFAFNDESLLGNQTMDMTVSFLYYDYSLVIVISAMTK